MTPTTQKAGEVGGEIVIEDDPRPPAEEPPAKTATLAGVTGKPSAAELLTTAGALLTRSHLRELGLGRAAIDSVFGKLPGCVPGSNRPMIHVEDYLRLVEASTYEDDRVRFKGQ